MFLFMLLVSCFHTIYRKRGDHFSIDKAATYTEIYFYAITVSKSNSSYNMQMVLWEIGRQIPSDSPTEINFALTN